MGWKWGKSEGQVSLMVRKEFLGDYHLTKPGVGFQNVMSRMQPGTVPGRRSPVILEVQTSLAFNNKLPNESRADTISRHYHFSDSLEAVSISMVRQYISMPSFSHTLAIPAKQPFSPVECFLPGIHPDHMNPLDEP